MYVRISTAVLFLIFLIANILPVAVPQINASSKSPYASGYDHGCDDAKISDPDDNILTNPKKVQTSIPMNL